MKFGPLALAALACPLAVTDGGVCWSSALEAESSSVASPVGTLAFDNHGNFNGDCWQSESDDKLPDIPGSSSSSVSALPSGTSGSERVAWKMHLDMLAGSGCGVKAKHNAYYLYTVRSLHNGELLLCQAVWRIHPLIIVMGESKVTRTGLHGPPPYLKNRECKHQSYAKCCILSAPRHKTPSLIIAGPPTNKMVQ